MEGISSDAGAVGAGAVGTGAVGAGREGGGGGAGKGAGSGGGTEFAGAAGAGVEAGGGGDGEVGGEVGGCGGVGGGPVMTGSSSGTCPTPVGVVGGGVPTGGELAVAPPFEAGLDAGLPCAFCRSLIVLFSLSISAASRVTSRSSWGALFNFSSFFIVCLRFSKAARRGFIGSPTGGGGFFEFADAGGVQGTPAAPTSFKVYSLNILSVSLFINYFILLANFSPSRLGDVLLGFAYGGTFLTFGFTRFSKTACIVSIASSNFPSGSYDAFCNVPLSAANRGVTSPCKLSGNAYPSGDC